MVLICRLPLLLPGMTTAVTEAVHAPIGAAMAPGHKLLDLRVDLSGSVAHDCPPVSYFRLVMRERAWLRRLTVAPGKEVALNTALAWFTTTAEEAAEGEPERAARIAWGGILPPVSLAAGHQG